MCLYENETHVANYCTFKLRETKGCRALADFFVVDLQIFCRVKICRAISLPHTSRFLVATKRVKVCIWSRVIQNQDAPIPLT